MRSKTPIGFTLVELVVVMAVIAILTAIAYPMYGQQALKTRRAEGWSLLLNAAQQQERFYTANAGYTAIVGSGGLELPPPSGQSPSADGLSVISPNGYYIVRAAVGKVVGSACSITGVSADTGCYILTATAQGTQAQDKDQGKVCFGLTLDSLGNKNSIPSAGGTANGWPSGGTPYCWSK